VDNEATRMNDGILDEITLIVDTTARVGEAKRRPGREWSYTLTVERPAYVGPATATPPPFPVAASAIIEVSNDGKGWILFGTLDAPLTDNVSVDPTGIYGDKAYIVHRATITSITGVGAKAYVSAVRGL
jgi:hypothetical protein